MLAWILLFACGVEPAAQTAPTVTPAPEMMGPTFPNPEATRLAASHVLIAFVGAANVPAAVTRDKEAARTLAQGVVARLERGESMAAVARELSDDSTAPRGGSLGAFNLGTMVEPFEQAVLALEPGELSGVVESPFGFHVVRRDPLLQVRASHLYVGYAGADRVPEGVTRSKEEARARIEEIRGKILAGVDFAQSVRDSSDGPLRHDAGDLGWFGRRQLAPQLDEPAFELRVGEVSAVLESPRGFHLLLRTQ
jgi:hypothetical protein